MLDWEFTELILAETESKETGIIVKEEKIKLGKKVIECICIYGL